MWRKYDELLKELKEYFEEKGQEGIPQTNEEWEDFVSDFYELWLENDCGIISAYYIPEKIADNLELSGKWHNSYREIMEIDTQNGYVYFADER